MPREETHEAPKRSKEHNGLWRRCACGYRVAATATTLRPASECADAAQPKLILEIDRERDVRHTWQPFEGAHQDLLACRPVALQLTLVWSWAAHFRLTVVATADSHLTAASNVRGSLTRFSLFCPQSLAC